MNYVQDLFTKLVTIHLLFWKLSFQYFDALTIFVPTLVAVGVGDLFANGTLSETGQFTAFQFVVAVCCYAFCYAWIPFRRRFADIANNMICLSLSIAVLAGIFALAITLALKIEVLNRTVGLAVRGFMMDLEIFPWSSRISFCLILFAIAYALIAINTFAVEGWASIRNAIFSRDVVPLVVSFLISVGAALTSTSPIIITMSR
jgi:hypothetical protein